ncbi:MAG: dual specificity protein phosphatase family protein [Elusimicrobia bacterium]|nr:dual specificity protein phosphatase family protein [Elusimicrobiota bacterium]
MKKYLNLFWIIALLSITVVFPGVAAERSALPRNDIPGLSNFAKVSAEVYRGAQPEPKSFAALEKMGIKTIVNLRDFHSDEKWIKGMGFYYVSIPMAANNIGDDETVAFLKVITNPKYKPYFVHCQHGSDRTGTMVALYRMYVQKWPRQKALGELPVYGFHEYFYNLRRYLKKVDLNILRAKVAVAPDPIFYFIQ